MLEYIILTKPAEKEDKNTIKLMNGQILQAGLKKDVESIESYLDHVDWAEHFEKHSKMPLKNHYYFVNGAIRIRRYLADDNLKLFPLKPYLNMQGSVYYRAKAEDILFQFDKKIKELFPDAEYKLKIKYLACCTIQPRIMLQKGDSKQIRSIFHEFKLADAVDKTEYEQRTIHAELKYEEDYEEYLEDYYDCPKCDPNPCWGRYLEKQPEQDEHDEFYEQKMPKRSKGSPKAFCFGTRTKERPVCKEIIELGCWKLTLEELLSRIDKPKEDDVLEALIEERRMRVLTGKIKISLADKPIDFYEITETDIEPYKKLIELEEKGLIKGYHAK